MSVPVTPYINRVGKPRGCTVALIAAAVIAAWVAVAAAFTAAYQAVMK